MPVRQIKLVLAYDGTGYSGWQFQPERPTVQGALQAALGRILKHDVQTTGCGRTDAGVHALRYTATFLTESTMPAAAFRPALNTYLPDDMTVLHACEAPRDFHPISDIKRKRYRYLLCDGPEDEIFLRRYVWQRRGPLDAPRMDRAAQSLVGTHDFSSFESAGSPRVSSVRTVFEVSVRRVADLSPWSLMFGADDDPQQTRETSPLIAYEIEADGFLYNMVRSVVGTLVEVGRGFRDESWVAEVLAKRDRSAAGQTAPPQGLFMVGTVY